VSVGETGPAPAGVRPAPGSHGGTAGRLRWVATGGLPLALGDRVAVLDDGREWLGEVVVPPDRLVEWMEPEGLPVVGRRVPDAEWPTTPATDGRRLLESLGLPPERADLLARARPASSSGALPPADD
jgi:hypothetical protein